MSYQALYRQWRPLNFDEVIGQSHIIAPLKNQIISGTYGHAYIFSGTRGTGKTSTAKIFARTVNCLNPIEGNPCNVCEHCKSILDDQFIDVIEMDAASNNSVDDIRELREHVKFSPSKGKYKVYIIDEVHMLSQGAFNALLKTLEEPPEYVLFILATTELQKIPATILSRCQRFDFKRVSYDDILLRLKHICDAMSVVYEEDALRLIIEKSDGAVRDSLSALDQCMATHEGSLKRTDVVTLLGIVEKSQIIELIGALGAGKTHEAMLSIDSMMRQGKDLTQLLNSLIGCYRDVLIAKTTQCSHHGLLIQSSDEYIESIREVALPLSKTHINRALELLIELSKGLKYSQNKRTLFEAALFKIMNPIYDDGIEALLERLEKLESGIVIGKPLGEGYHEVQHPVKHSQPLPVSSTNTVKPEEASSVSSQKQVLNSEEIEHFIEFKEGDITLEDIESIYVAFLEEVKSKKQALHPFFIGSKPQEILGNKCTIAISSENKLFISVLSSPNNINDLNLMLGRLVKKNIQISFSVSDDVMKHVNTTEEIKNYFEAYKNVLQIKED